jgi:hypothetical protein
LLRFLSVGSSDLHPIALQEFSASVDLSGYHILIHSGDMTGDMTGDTTKDMTGDTTKDMILVDMPFVSQLALTFVSEKWQ